MTQIRPALSRQPHPAERRRWPSHAAQYPGGGARWSGDLGRGVLVPPGRAGLSAGAGRNQNIQNFWPTTSSEPKVGERRRLYHRTQRIHPHLLQRLTAPYHRRIVICLPAGISHDPEAGRGRQVPKNDRTGQLYPYVASNRPIGQSPPGGCCRIFAAATLGPAKSPEKDRR